MAALTKRTLIDALTAKGVELTGEETVADLKKLVADNGIDVTEPEEDEQPKTGIIKEYVQNGHLYRRIRGENGVVKDVRV